MPFDPEQIAKQVQRELKAYSTRYLNERVKWMQPYPVGMRLKALVNIQRGNWTALGQLAAAYRRSALRDLTAIKRQREALKRLASHIESLSEAVRQKHNWIRPNRRPDWTQLRATVIRGLRRKGFTDSQARQGANAVATATLTDLIGVTEKPLELWTQQLEAAVIPRLSTLAAANVAEAVAQFNIKVDSRKLAKPKPNTIRHAGTDVERLLKALHRTLRSERRP